MRPHPTPTPGRLNWRETPERYNVTFELNPDEAMFLYRGGSDLVQIHHFPAEYGPTTKSDLRSLSGKRVLLTCGGDPIVIANIHEVEPPEKDGDGWTLEAWAEEFGEYVVIEPDNAGTNSHRIANEDDYWNRVEREFARKWAADNDYTSLDTRCMNDGRGILQGIIGKEFGRVTERERKVAATVVQWLGTNCGRCWMFEALLATGHKIEEPSAPRAAYYQNDEIPNEPKP